MTSALLGSLMLVVMIASLVGAVLALRAIMIATETPLQKQNRLAEQEAQRALTRSQKGR